jgi:hypothetical protein
MDNPAFVRGPFSRRAAWAWLVEQAAWRDGLTRPRPPRIVVPRGAVAASAREIATCWEWTSNKVRNFIRTLERADMLRVEGGPDALLIVHVVNYANHAVEDASYNGSYAPFLVSPAKIFKGSGGRYLPSRVRETIFAASGGVCFYCDSPLTRDGGLRQFHVDHKKAVVRGGTDDPDNLVASCADCNLRKGSTPIETFLGRLSP